MESRKRKFESLSLEAREQFAENTRERIYSTITLLAVLAALWHTVQYHSALGVIASIAGTVVGLWLATLMSDRMSYRAVHGRGMPIEKYRKILFAASGLLAPAAAPLILVALSMTEILTLKTALTISIILLLLSLFLFSVVGSRRIYASKQKILIISLLELLIGIGVVALKLLIGE
ncbi:MAG: hypothetical protein UY35_C0001G0119 [Candidatus Saccharibacteria bacterium GW2011_GWC2_48_9]|nr:MAG: hypothetical protein UY35_C0001G0119 [Candidatus Saccharibacteria bacterium GW2011_GWC2_48_9]HCH34810.1 hypothetical protein [Candidatus Saccharibacteria bacterium]